MIYLNHAGTSWPKPETVREAAARALACPPETWGDALERDHAAVCGSLGVTDPARLLLTPGATSALSVAVSDHPWQTGDRVITSSLEHHALHRPVQQLAQHGVEVVTLPCGDGEPVALDALRTELRKGKVRLVAVTAASNVTGEVLPLDPVIRLAREHGALSLIDAAQIAGWIALDLDRLGADLVAFAGHKGPQAPWGIGGLYVSPTVMMASPRAACELPASGDPTPCAPMPGYCDVGSVDRSGLAGLAAGFAWLADPARAERLPRAQAQIAHLARAALTAPGVTVHGHGGLEPGASKPGMPTLALTVEGRPPAELAAGLLHRGVIASAGLQCAPLAHETLGTLPLGVLRLSIGPATTQAEIETATEALTETLTSSRSAPG